MFSKLLLPEVVTDLHHGHIRAATLVYFARAIQSVLHTSFKSMATNI
jgi:hypothetical protein